MEGTVVEEHTDEKRLQRFFQDMRDQSLCAYGKVPREEEDKLHGGERV